MKKTLAQLITSVAATCGLLYAATAGATNLAELPLKASVLAKPNVIFGMDDSGSMDWEIMLSTISGEFWWNWDERTGWNSNGSFRNTGSIDLSYLFPSNTITSNGNSIEQMPGWSVPPTPQFASLRSSDYHSLYYNPDPSVKYDDWSPGNDGATTKDYAPISIANALASTPSVLAPLHPNGNATLDLMKERLWEVTVYDGMTIPAGAWIDTGGWSYTYWSGWQWVSNWSQLNGETRANGTTKIRVNYYPATYWKRVSSAECTNGVVCTNAPEGGDWRLRRYEIKRANYTSDDAFKADIQKFANWFAYYRKRALMLGGAMGKVLEGMTGLRVGVVQFNSRTNAKMYDLDSTVPSDNGQRVAGIFYANPRSGGTPTRETLKYIGEQYKRTDAADSKGNKIIQYACQRNNAFLVTDGFYNGSDTYAPSYTRSTWGGADPFQTTRDNTLADLALAYYTLNPRTDLSTGRVPKGDPSAANPDKNTDLHVNTYGLTLNVQGDMWTGSEDFPTGAINWPVPATDSRSAIDDMWHATMNGRGKMYIATDPKETALKIDAGLRDILSQVSAQGGVAVSSVNLDTGDAKDAKAYLGSYNPAGWFGDLEARPINRATGDIDSGSLSWVDTAGNPASAGSLLAARDWTTRFIISSTGALSGAGIEFTSGTVGSTVNPNSAKYTNDEVVDYLRGKRAGEGWDNQPIKFRRRDEKRGLIGPVVNAEPTLDPESKVAYVASGEGMLHAFDTDTGAELWAYVPYDGLSQIGKTVERGYTFLTKLDGTPAVGRSSTTGRLLVAGMGAAGRAYYALDVSSPRPATQGEAKGMVSWTFPAAGDATNRALMGYTVGKPQIVRTANNGYVALVTSGYDNGINIGDGRGRLWMLNASTGAVIKTFKTTTGVAGAEAGLAHVTAALEPDGSVRYVYGGDLLGNVWKFDLNQSGNGELTPSLLAVLKDASGNVQPVTAAPAVVRLNGNLVVMVGTGRLLDVTDFGTSQVQTFYAIKDGAALSNARSSLVVRSFPANGSNTLEGPTLDWNTGRGWYLDLPSGDQANTKPTVGYNSVAFVTNRTGASDCSASSRLYVVDVETGSKPATVDKVLTVLSSVSNSSGGLMLKTTKGDLRVVGQYWEPKKQDDNKYQQSWNEKADDGTGITTGKNAWREILKQ